MTDLFPINYLKTIWSPVKSFRNRHQLNWFKIIITLLLINLLMAVPVMVNFLNYDNIPSDFFYSEAIEAVDEDAIEELKSLETKEGELFFDDSFLAESKKGVTAVNVSPNEKEAIRESETYIIFDEEDFLIKNSEDPEIIAPYTKDMTFKDIVNQKDIIEQLGQQLFNQNKVLVASGFALSFSIIHLIILLVITFGVSFLLYLTKKSSLTSIGSYRESVNLTLNLLGLPSLIATAFGFIYFNAMLMDMIQIFGLMAMLMTAYGKTQLKDSMIS